MSFPVGIFLYPDKREHCRFPRRGRRVQPQHQPYGPDRTTRKLRIRDRLKLSQSTRILEFAFVLILVQDGVFSESPLGS